MRNLFLVPLATFSLAASAASLCEKDEQVIYGCTVKSGKILSVCASKDLSKTAGYLQYRFGTSEKIELQFPADRKKTQKHFRYHRHTGPGVTMLRLKFAKDGTEYKLFSDDQSQGEESQTSDGVTVTPPKKQPIDIACTDKPEGSLMKLDDFIKIDENL